MSLNSPIKQRLMQLTNNLQSQNYSFQNEQNQLINDLTNYYNDLNSQVSQITHYDLQENQKIEKNIELLYHNFQIYVQQNEVNFLHKNMLQSVEKQLHEIFDSFQQKLDLIKLKNQRIYDEFENMADENFQELKMIQKDILNEIQEKKLNIFANKSQQLNKIHLFHEQSNQKEQKQQNRQQLMAEIKDQIENQIKQAYQGVFELEQNRNIQYEECLQMIEQMNEDITQDLKVFFKLKVESETRQKNTDFILDILEKSTIRLGQHINSQY